MKLPVRNAPGRLPTVIVLNSTEQQERFDDWTREHAAILHHVANGFAEGADRQDLMQELLLAVWKAIPAFRGESQVTSFLFRVTHNTALTWRRTRHNYQRRVERFEALTPSAPTDAPPDRSGVQLEQLYAAIRQLPPVDRSLMLLSLDGLSYREMAGVHGLTESNVGVRLNRARQKLTESLKNISHELD